MGDGERPHGDSEEGLIEPGEFLVPDVDLDADEPGVDEGDTAGQEEAANR